VGVCFSSLDFGGGAATGAGLSEPLFASPPPSTAAIRKTTATTTRPAIAFSAAGIGLRDRLAGLGACFSFASALGFAGASACVGEGVSTGFVGASEGGISALIGCFRATTGKATRGAVAGWSANLLETG
jgi:hypothetical protein